MDEQHELDPPEPFEPVEHELREPLLVDPGATVRPDRERVVGGKPVLGDDSSREQRHPAVRREGAAEVRDEDGGEGRNDDDYRAVLVEHPGDPRDRGLLRGRRLRPRGDRLLARVHRLLMQAPAADA